MMIPRLFQFSGFKTTDIKEFLNRKTIEIHLTRKSNHLALCTRCQTALINLSRGYQMKVEHLHLMGHRCFLFFVRQKGYCSACKKTRSEKIDFISDETPHKTKELSWFIGRMCEIAPVSRVAELLEQDGFTTWRMDFKRMKQMAQHYKISSPEAISVDEVYARRTKKEDENRSDLFFTVISDLKTRKVIWVSFGRSKEALDQFFILLGASGCKKIKVIATDQFQGYRASAREYCPQAKLVWDRFHIIQNFEKALDSDRRTLHQVQPNGSYVKRMSAGKYRFIFLTKASRRTKSDQENMEELIKINTDFFKLELIKEKVLMMYNAKSAEEAREIFDEVGGLILTCGFKSLWSWHDEIEKNWEHIKNYFEFRVSTGLSEGINNVIKMIKRRAFGYRNMEYFRLKIMQVCGYLNSRFIPDPNYAQNPIASS